MDDDKILERGGTQRDIEEYARMNGADSTDTDKEFEKDAVHFFHVAYGLGELGDRKNMPVAQEEYVQFLHRREQEVRKEVVEELWNLLAEHYWDSLSNERDLILDHVRGAWGENLSALSNTKNT